MELLLTPSQTIGPFFHLCLTTDESAGRLLGPETKGEHIQLVCRVLDGDGAPVDDAMIELWQADADGSHGLFGRLATNDDGVCVFETIRPGCDRTLQAPHINVSIFARGLLKRLATRVYFTDDASNGDDAVLALVPMDRRETLMARADRANAARWTFEIHLCGERETVFFDV
ncbi:MAG: protocatechuate 3,4-dioxygenase subunit alpha [Bryobacteraceae bacterium]|jgi:protocatechuate 3,4-dioxygenase alpha subunit